MTDYFHNFAPADAVQYDGTNAQMCAEIAANGDWLADTSGHLVRYSGHGTWDAIPVGQWLVRQGSRVWVQDEEPARVERWEWSWGWATDDAPNWLAVVVEGVSDARPYISAEKIAPVTRYRRPILDNEWRGGPWSPVEGGAE